MTWKEWLGEKWTLNGHKVECTCHDCCQARYDSYDESQLKVYRAWWELPVQGAMWLMFIRVLFWWASR